MFVPVRIYADLLALSYQVNIGLLSRGCDRRKRIRVWDEVVDSLCSSRGAHGARLERLIILRWDEALVRIGDNARRQRVSSR